MSWNKVPVRVGDLQFESMRACADYFGVDPSTVFKRVENGTLWDIAGSKLFNSGRRKVRCMKTGKEWESATACAIEMGKSQPWISRLARGGLGYVYVDGAK